jgi:sialic acid synthase SpsE
MVIKNWKPTKKAPPVDKATEFYENFFDAYFFVLDGSDSTHDGKISKAW